jgi:hypothetical protein
MNEPQLQMIMHRLDRIVELMQAGRKKKKKKWKQAPKPGAEAVRVAEQSV